MYTEGILANYPRKMGISSSMHLGAKDFPGRWKGPKQRAISLRHIKGEKTVPLKAWNLYLVPAQATFKFWHNPFSIGGVADAMMRNYSSIIPRYISPEKKELIDMRDQWYGRPLDWHEWMELGRLAPSDVILAYIWRESWNAEPTFNDNTALRRVVSLITRFPGLGHFVTMAKTLRHDDVADLMEKWVGSHLVLESRKNKQDEREREAREKQELDRTFEIVTGGYRNPLDEKEELEDWYDNQELRIPGDPYEDPEEVVEEVQIEDYFDHDFTTTKIVDEESCDDSIDDIANYVRDDEVVIEDDVFVL
jgi:hypothetical protein